ncbi:DUF397 domain-containing protein [Streptomyces sp. NPDC048281]|uniref:DUF397 domain-containing protein n=1 Tax=Streptomyces sp. NPDC048281 TaxID=3154715 RepID=UPI00342B5901
MNPETLDWFKSSYSSNDGPDCVEVAISPAGAPTVRDSKDKDGARLTFGAASWASFISADGPGTAH